MNAPRPANTCTITWNPLVVNLDQFAVFVDYLADLYSDVAVPYVIDASWHSARPGELPDPPRLIAIRMNSPLIAELLSPENEVGVLALGVVGYILKHPETLGGWVGRARTAWYETRRRAAQARQEYQDELAQLREEQEYLNALAQLPKQQEYLRSLAPITAEGPSIEHFTSTAEVTDYPQPSPDTVREPRPDRAEEPPHPGIGRFGGPDTWPGGPGHGRG